MFLSWVGGRSLVYNRFILVFHTFQKCLFIDFRESRERGERKEERGWRKGGVGEEGKEGGRERERGRERKSVFLLFVHSLVDSYVP